MITSQKIVTLLPPGTRLEYRTDYDGPVVSTTPEHAMKNYIIDVVLGLIDRTDEVEELAWLLELDSVSQHLVYYETHYEERLREKLEAAGIRFENDGYVDGVFKAAIARILDDLNSNRTPEVSSEEAGTYAFIRAAREAYV